MVGADFQGDGWGGERQRQRHATSQGGISPFLRKGIPALRDGSDNPEPQLRTASGASDGGRIFVFYRRNLLLLEKKRNIARIIEGKSRSP